MKKFLILSLISTSLFFTGCGNDEPTTNEDVGIQAYEAPEFIIDHPSDWEVLGKDQFTSNVPTNTVVAFKNNIQNEIFTANLNVTLIPVEENTNVEDFFKESMAQAKTTLVSFEEISSEASNVSQGEERIAAYTANTQGKISADGPIIQFEQLYSIKDKTAYVVTGAYLSTEDESVVKKIDAMLNSFSLK